MKKLLIILSVAIIVVGGGVGAYAVMNKSDDKTADKTSGSSESMDGMDMSQSNGTNSSNSNSSNGGTQDSGSSDNSGNSSSAVSTDQVKISNFSFTPGTITVKVGTKVTWTNNDVVQHNISMDDEADGPSSPMLGKGDTYTYTFKKAGTYKYHCTPHPYMKATVIVTE